MEITDAKSEITIHLTMLKSCQYRNGIPPGFTYAGTGDFLLQHGVWYEPRPLPKRIHRGVPRGCFRNALKLSRTRGYRYVEGYAVPDNLKMHLPIHHAWNLDREGNLIDNTWGEPGRAYFGVVFPLELADKVIRQQCKAGHYDTVLDNPRGEFEIFKNPWAGDKVCI